MKALVQRVYEPTRRPLFGQHTSRQTFKSSAYVDRVHNLLWREGTHHEATRIQLGEHAFLGKDGKRLANRGSRHAQLRCQLDLPNSLARREFAMQNHLANFYDDSGVFTTHFACSTIAGPEQGLKLAYIDRAGA